MVHCENSFNRVCRSGILSVSCHASNSVVLSCSLKKLLAKAADPTGGDPSSLNPSVSSMAVVDPWSFCCSTIWRLCFGRHVQVKGRRC